jgi:hypothetical protein
VQHALIDPQLARGERVARTRFDQLPSSQRGGRRQRRPVRIRQRRQRQTEGRVGARVTLPRRAERGKRGIEFRAGTQQHHVAFERGQRESAAQRIDRGRR